VMFIASDKRFLKLPSSAKKILKTADKNRSMTSLQDLKK